MVVSEWPQSPVTFAYMCGHDMAATIPWVGLSRYHAHISRNLNRVSRFVTKKVVAAVDGLPVVRFQ